jgi:hypothetical protein
LAIAVAGAVSWGGVSLAADAGTGTVQQAVAPAAESIQFPLTRAQESRQAAAAVEAATALRPKAGVMRVFAGVNGGYGVQMERINGTRFAVLLDQDLGLVGYKPLPARGTVKPPRAGAAASLQAEAAARHAVSGGDARVVVVRPEGGYAVAFLQDGRTVQLVLVSEDFEVEAVELLPKSRGPQLEPERITGPRALDAEAAGESVLPDSHAPAALELHNGFVAVPLKTAGGQFNIVLLNRNLKPQRIVYEPLTANHYPGLTGDTKKQVEAAALQKVPGDVLGSRRTAEGYGVAVGTDQGLVGVQVNDHFEVVNSRPLPL